MESQIHLIRVIGLTETEKILTFGYLTIKDKEWAVFNPSLLSARNLHWTWHKNGMGWAKNQDGKKMFEFRRQPLDTFTRHSQFLSECFGLESKFNMFIEYKKEDASNLCAIDLRNFDKSISLSVHLCDNDHIEKCSKIFEKEKNHQVYIYNKSSPCIVLHFWEM